MPPGPLCRQGANQAQTRGEHRKRKARQVKKTLPSPAGNAAAPKRRSVVQKALWACGLSLFAAIVFCVALVVTVPATLVTEFVTLPAQITALYGGLWRGRATLQGGYTVDWVARRPDILSASLAYDLTLAGPDTRIDGQLGISPWTVRADAVTGRAGPGLLSLVPGLAITSCQSRAVVDVPMLRLARDHAAANGIVTIDAGTCTDVLDRRHSVPQMDLELLTQGDDALGLLRDRDGQLAQFTVTGDRRFIARIEPEGATMVPGLPTSGPIILEYPF